MNKENQNPLAGETRQELLDRIGQLTRALHEGMRALGLDKEVEKAAEAIPDACDRLAYIATTTEQAAERALSAIEVAQPLQDDMAARASKLDERWRGWFDAPMELAAARALVNETRNYLRWVPEQTRATNAELREIMMAQDFQDLTGQMIKKLVEVIRQIEQELVGVLLDYMPGQAGVERASPSPGSNGGRPDALLDGPQIRPEGRTDVVTDQAQVDDLLDELGF